MQGIGRQPLGLHVITKVRIDLNEYTSSGTVTASLCGAGKSQCSVYLIIAPCLSVSGTAPGLVALQRGNLRGITQGGEQVINSCSPLGFNSWSLDCGQKRQEMYNVFEDRSYIRIKTIILFSYISTLSSMYFVKGSSRITYQMYRYWQTVYIEEILRA